MTTIGLLLVYGLLAAAVAGFCVRLGRRPDRLTILAIVLLPLLFVSPGLFGPRTPVPTDHLAAYCVPWRVAGAPPPHNPMLTDVVSQFAPWARAVRSAWAARTFPWRDRWNGCGTPLAANGQSAAFSPFTLLLFALPLPRAFVLLAAAKLLVAMCGAWLWIRELGAGEDAARFGAVAFGLSFALTPWIVHPASAAVALWPWILFAIEYRDPARSRRGWWLLFALAAIWPLCGHLEVVAVATLFSAAWVALRRIGGELREPGRILALASAVFLGFALCGFLLVPQALAILASNRLRLAADPEHWSYVPWVPYRPGWIGAVWTSLFPRLFGDSVDAPMIAGAAGSLVEMGFGYVGLVAWACALVSRPQGPSAAKQRALTVLLLAGLGGAMGLGLFRIGFDAVPGIRLAPPLRLLLFVGISAAALAAFTLDRIGRSGPDAPGMVARVLASAAAVLCLGVVLFAHALPLHAAAGGKPAHVRAFAANAAVIFAVAAACAWFLLRRHASASQLVRILTLVAAAQLAYEGMRLYAYFPESSFYPQTPLVRFLRSRPGIFRVVGENVALFPNTNVFAGLEEVRTHDPIERRDYVEFLDRCCGYTPTDYVKRLRDPNAPALDFLNVRYLVSDPGRADPGPKWRRVYDGPDGTVFESATALPRFFAPEEVQVVSPARGTNASRDAMAAFGRPLWDAIATRNLTQRALVLDESAGAGIAGSGAVGAGLALARSAIARAAIVSETTNEIILETDVSGETRSGALIVGSVVQDGGWRATGERGESIPLHRANGPFLAFLATPGRHRVRLTYAPPGLGAGLAVSGAAAALCVAAAAVRGRRARS